MSLRFRTAAHATLEPSPTLAVGGHPGGTLRMGPLLPVPMLLREFGVASAPILARVGIDASWFDDAERPVNFRDVGCLLDACVGATGCAHFGLLVGQRFSPATLGLLGQLVQNCETVDASLLNLTLYLHLHDSGAVPVLLKLDANRFAIGYSVVHSQTQAAAQIHDGAIAVVHQLMHQLCGAFWAPLEVTFAHRSPADVEPFRRFFGAPLRFDAELTAVIFSTRWLAHRVEGADPVRHAQLKAAMRDATAAKRGRLDARVRRALHTMVFAGDARAPAVAQLLGLHERTLRRQLSAEGTSFQTLARQTRFDLAAQLLRDTRLPIAEIAAALQYADATAFTRAFSGWAGIAPGRWRAQASVAAGAI